MMPQAELLTLIHEQVKEIKLILTGNGTPQNGVVVRLDRVERTQRIYRWIVTASVSALLLAGATELFTLLTRK